MEAATKPASPSAGASQESKLHFLDYWRIIRIRKAIIVAVFLLVVITVTVVTFSLTPSFQSTARMRVEKDMPDVTPLGGAQSQTFDPYFIATEFEVLKSRMTLDAVVEDLGLGAIYAKRYKAPRELTTQESYDVLYRDVDVKQFRNTSIIEISVFDEDKQLAADIANKIAEVYKSNRDAQRETRSVRGLGTLTNNLADLNQKVDRLQKNVDALRIELKVADPVLASATAQSLSSQTLARIEATRTDLTSTLKAYEALLGQVKNKRDVELRQFLAVARPTQELTTLLGNLNQAEQQRTAVSPNLGAEHPEVKRLTLLIAKINDQIDREIAGIVSALEGQVRTTEAQLGALESEYQRSRDAMNEEFIKLAPYAAAKNELEVNTRLRDAMQLQLSQETVNARISRSDSVQITDRALPGLKPVKPSKVLNIALGSIFGLLLGVGLAFFIEYLDTSVKTIDDVEQALGAPVLGVIPQNVRPLHEEGPDSPHAEAYRVLRTNILFSRKDPGHRTLTVVSGGAGEGKSTTIFNLASIFAQNGSRVLIVDSDLRRPSLHKIMNVYNAIGLTNYLMRQNKLEEVVQTSPVPGLDFLPSGKLPSSSLGILNSVQMKAFIAEAKTRYDFVFFDSPPIMGVSDASVLVSEVDMAVLVVQYRKYPQQMTIRAKQMVEKIGGPGRLLGVVLNNINISQDSYYYYYSGYYYDYYSKSEDSKSDSEKPSGGRKKSAAVAGEVQKKF